MLMDLAIFVQQNVRWLHKIDTGFPHTNSILEVHRSGYNVDSEIKPMLLLDILCNETEKCNFLFLMLFLKLLLRVEFVMCLHQKKGQDFLGS